MRRHRSKGYVITNNMMDLPYNLYSRSWLGTGNNEFYASFTKYLNTVNADSLVEHHGKMVDKLGCNNKYNCIRVLRESNRIAFD